MVKSSPLLGARIAVVCRIGFPSGKLDFHGRKIRGREDLFSLMVEVINHVKLGNNWQIETLYIYFGTFIVICS